MPTQQWEYEAGWIKDAGCVLSPEIDVVVVKRITSLCSGRGKPTLCIRRKAAVLTAIGAKVELGTRRTYRKGACRKLST